MSKESFADLFMQSLRGLEMRPGSIVTGTVVDIDNDWVTVHAGLKSEGVIPRSQFVDEQGGFSLQPGDQVKVALEAVEDGFGETRLSREKAQRIESWMELETAYANNDAVIGVINGRVKGGFTVDLKNIRAFLPGSLVDVRPSREPMQLEGQQLEFRLIKLDRKRNNVVVSRRAALESVSSEEREALLQSLQEGEKVTGTVKNLTEYGAFVDLGGVDGLLHITDMSWKRIRHPGEIVNVGDQVEVKILKFDRERNRVSLGMKQLGDDPWVGITSRYPENIKVKAVVTNLTEYGCFAELEEGVEGLVHVSEMDWTNRNVHPSKVVQLGQEVEVMVLDIDEERRRISLGIKQCSENPWDAFASSHQKGDKVKGSIKSITDFGIFIGLQESIDGLVHLSDISWDDNGEKAAHQYQKGDEVEAVILAIDPERERISLGIKQLVDDPFMAYLSRVEKGSIVNGKVAAVEEKNATVTLEEGVDGVLRAGEISMESKVKDARTALKKGDELEVKVVGVDRKKRILNLSAKAAQIDAERAAVEGHRQQKAEAEAGAGGGGTIGDLLKAELGKDGKDQDD